MMTAALQPNHPPIRRDGKTPSYSSSQHEFDYFHERRLRKEEDLRRSFQLRYQVYCEERHFLAAEAYSDRLEADEFDKSSLHFGSFDTQERLVGTVRLVRGAIHNLPVDQHCDLYPAEMRRLSPITHLAEISRLAVSRAMRRRASDEPFGPAHPKTLETQSKAEGKPNCFTIVLTLYRAIYHALKRHDIRHVLAAMEPSLFRITTSYHFPFREIGPTTDYYGAVKPYSLDLEELDAILAESAPELLQYFNSGLDLPDQSSLAA
jgi:N-acyl amino acid synthase of PEP-CTERM/exosortase system